MYILIPFVVLYLTNITLIFIELGRDSKKKKDIVSLSLMVLILIIVFVFPTRVVKSNIEVHLWESFRLKIVERIENKELLPNKNGNISLSRFSTLTSSDYITVYNNSTNDMVVAFYQYYAIQSTPIQVIYSEKGKKEIIRCISNDRILKIKKLKNNWYYVIQKE